MRYEDLKARYEQMKKMFGTNAYKHVSQLLAEAKEQHKKDWERNPTRAKDHEQSWRAFKGKNLEKLLADIIKDEVEALGLRVVNGNTLERAERLNDELARVKNNLLIDYNEFGKHLPDVDLIIYSPKTCRILAVVSSKVTLRERIAQTGYWKIKLSHQKNTRHIKVLFVTPDEDKTLSKKEPTKKGRAIVETDTNGTYVMSESVIEESEKVRPFHKFIDDLRKLLCQEKQ